jgi:hypothetical protein
MHAITANLTKILGSKCPQKVAAVHLADLAL